MIKISKLYKKFDSQAFKTAVEVLKGVDFTLKEGRTIGFLGANGAGKTTLMKIMMGFIFPSSGEIIFSKSLGRNPLEALKKIGYMPERPYFYPYLKGSDFIKYMGELSEVSKESIVKNMNYWGKRFNLDHALDREIKGYSKGMLQRLGFIAALVHDPKLIILDEPLSGLDPLGRKEFKDVIREIKRQGKTIFFSSHILSDIEEVCDDVIFLEKGKVAFQGSLQEIYNQAKDYQVEIFFKGDEKKLEIFGKRSIEAISSDVFKILMRKSEQSLILKELEEKGMDVLKLNPIGQSLEEVFYFSSKGMAE